MATKDTLQASRALPEAVARRLIRAYSELRPVAGLPEDGPGDADAAYAAQRAVWRTMVGDLRPTAWKVGAPDRATEPAAAPVFPRRLATSPAAYPRGTFLGMGIEAEIAFRFGRDLPVRSRPYARTELLDAIAHAHVAMELVDTRLADPAAAGPMWRLADHLLNGALVIGGEISRWRELDYSRVAVRVLGEGRLLAETLGRPPLDDLFHCLPWWLNHVGGARAGDIVTTGAWNGMHPVALPTRVRVEFVGLGRASAHIA
jgi:2-keto-4-pentenoate hydratase